MNYIIVPGIVDNKKKGPIKFYSAERIIQVVTEHFGITPERLMEKTNRMEVVYPRQIAMYVFRNYSRLSLREIKEQVLHQNHASPIYSNRIIKGRMKVDERVRYDVLEIVQNL